MTPHEYNKQLKTSLERDLTLYAGGAHGPTGHELQLLQAIDEIDRQDREAARVRERQRQHRAANMWLRDRQHEWQDMVRKGYTAGIDEAEFFRIPDDLQPR
jgi:hypothetical protein